MWNDTLTTRYYFILAAEPLSSECSYIYFFPSYCSLMQRTQLQHTCGHLQFLKARSSEWSELVTIDLFVYSRWSFVTVTVFTHVPVCIWQCIFHVFQDLFILWIKMYNCFLWYCLLLLCLWRSKQFFFKPGHEHKKLDLNLKKHKVTT